MHRFHVFMFLTKGHLGSLRGQTRSFGGRVSWITHNSWQCLLSGEKYTPCTKMFKWSTEMLPSPPSVPIVSRTSKYSEHPAFRAQEASPRRQPGEVHLRQMRQDLHHGCLAAGPRGYPYRYCIRLLQVGLYTVQSTILWAAFTDIKVVAACTGTETTV